MNKKIIITSCLECPHKDHKGAFAPVSYIPYCTKTRGELPYKAGVRQTNVGPFVYATYTNEIPSWCPLTDDTT
jgi:hypothetical protein